MRIVLRPRQRLRVIVLFLAALWAANRLVVALCRAQPFDCPPTWPFSVFYGKLPQPDHLLAAVAALALFAPGWRWLSRSGFALWRVLLVSLVLLLLTNLAQGWERAFAVPVAGEPYTWTLAPGGHEYYHDALRVSDPLGFVRNFVAGQPELGVHARTHPPGAVLVFWLLAHLAPAPAQVGLLLALSAALLCLTSFQALLAAHVERRLAGYGTLLYALVPAFQVYTAVSLDALVAGLLLTALVLYLRDGRWSGIGAALAVWLASWLSFGALFLLPVLFGHALLRRRLPRLAGLLLVVVLAHVAVALLTGFDYSASFQVAARLENPEGFRLFSEPLSYLMTRLENAAEVVVFFGPFLTLLALAGLRQRGELAQLARLGLLTLLVMFATGAFRTGETARACLFIFPYGLAAVVAALGHEPHDERGWYWLAWLVFGQSLLMQLLGSYFW